MIALAIAPSAALAQVDTTPQNEPLGDLPLNPEWLSNTLERASKVGQVENNLAPGAIDSRNAATKAYEAARNSGKNPSPFSKPEYTVMWSAKQNVADVNADVLSKFVQNLTINPQGLADLANPQFLPGLDGFQVIDERKLNVDGSPNPTYGNIVNFVQLPLPWGVETEAHHMQYEWHDGDPIIAGGLFNDSTFVLDPTDIPNLTLKNIIAPQDTLLGSIPDAYDSVGDGRFIGTYMGGPEANFGGSPGSVDVFKPDPDKGLVLESETPAGNVGGIASGNANGVPEPCSLRESRPLGTCANPHGIEIRQDLKTMITADYAEPREIVLDPIKNVDKYAFRPTVRSWDTSDPSHPKLVSVSHMPNGPLEPAQRAHEQYGIMEDAKTWPDATKYKGGLESKGGFAGSMCGGGVFFTPDISALKGDASSKWNQVWNDGLSEIALKGQGNGEYDNEPGGCAGGAWHQVTPSNTMLFRGVQGRNPGSDNYFDTGQGKMLYNLDIRRLIKSAQDGHVTCDLSRGIHEDGIDLTGIQLFNKLAKGEQIADCPTLNSELEVNDPTTGGPHWAALDNHSVDQRGMPYRLMFSDYFVSRTGVDGDHRAYTVNISPTGKLSYDTSFRDEQTGALGINFNRRNWPGSPDAGFYKPHSMIWVCPPGVCTDKTEITPRALGSASGSGDVSSIPGSRAAENKCQRSSASGQVKASNIPGFGRVRVRLQGNSSAPAGTPLYVSVIAGKQVSGVGYSLDGKSKTASGRQYRLAISPKMLKSAGRHTILVKLRSAAGQTRTVTLRFKTLKCNAVLAASQNKRGAGSLLRLRVDSLKALTRVVFTVPAATLKKATAAIVRVRTTAAKAQRFRLTRNASGVLEGKTGAVSVEVSKGKATLTGLPDNAGIVRLNLRTGAKKLSSRVLKANAVAGGSLVKLKAKIKR